MKKSKPKKKIVNKTKPQKKAKVAKMVKVAKKPAKKKIIPGRKKISHQKKSAPIKLKRRKKVSPKKNSKLKPKSKIKLKKLSLKTKTKKANQQINKLKRYIGNPIIRPASNAYWESTATFNPTAFLHDGKVHILYRAVGAGDISTIGYAWSDNGYNLIGRTFKPIFIHKNKPVDYAQSFASSSGGGWNGGAEDPRITLIDDRLYMTYTAFDGWGSMRVGLTSISLNDFLNKKWDWREPVLISPPEQHNKNWVLFPEKINGKFAILHDLWPTVSVVYVDKLEDLSEGKQQVPKYWSRTWYKALPKSWIVVNSGTGGDRSVDPDKFKENIWTGDFKDIWVRATGPAPIKTKYGWLILYHAIEKKDPGKFKVFAMLLDIKDPTKVLYRSKEAILEPDSNYENEGIKPGIVYVCGAVVKEGNLFVYYGGADTVSCVAVANLNLFLDELVKSGITKLKRKRK